MLEKLYLMGVAGALTTAACKGQGQAEALDPANPGKLTDLQKLENLKTWEVFKVFYGGLVAAAENEEFFPAPKFKADASGLAGSIVNGVGAALSGTQFKPLLDMAMPFLLQLIANATKATPQQVIATSPIPAPGK